MAVNVMQLWYLNFLSCKGSFPKKMLLFTRTNADVTYQLVNARSDGQNYQVSSRIKNER